MHIYKRGKEAPGVESRILEKDESSRLHVEQKMKAKTEASGLGFIQNTKMQTPLRTEEAWCVIVTLIAIITLWFSRLGIHSPTQRENTYFLNDKKIESISV